MKVRTLVAAAAGSALLLTGCGGAEESSEDAVIEQYFTALASADLVEMENAADSAAEDSPAARYLTHQLNVVRAHIANGKVSPSEREAEITGDAAKVCLLRQCADYGDFTFEDGRLASFSADGTSLDGRIMIGDGEIIDTDDLVGYEVLSAAVSADDDQTLTVVMRFHTYDMMVGPSGSAVYRAPNGDEVESSPDSIEPRHVFPDSHQLGLLVFPDAEIGGEVITRFTASEDDDVFVTDDVKYGEARFPVSDD